jgi:hypothetical protein
MKPAEKPIESRPFKVTRPFTPDRSIGVDVSGFCLACAAIRYGGCQVDEYGMLCLECGEPKVVGRSDAVMLLSIDIEIVDIDRDGSPA